MVLEKQAHRESNLVVAKGEEGGKEMEREFGVSKSKLLYIYWINNEVLLFSTISCDTL